MKNAPNPMMEASQAPRASVATRASEIKIRARSVHCRADGHEQKPQDPTLTKPATALGDDGRLLFFVRRRVSQRQPMGNRPHLRLSLRDSDAGPHATDHAEPAEIAFLQLAA
jgi:hypothetical protein